MTPSAPNPFAPTSSIQDDLGVFGDARLVKKGFLHRIIQFNILKHGQTVPGDLTSPEDSREYSQRCPIATLTYNGWWFVQRVHVDGKLIWWAISWLSIRPSIEIAIPPRSLDHADRSLSSDTEPTDTKPTNIKIEIDFARGLKIRRFRVWVDQEIRYDEIC